MSLSKFNVIVATVSCSVLKYVKIFDLYHYFVSFKQKGMHW